MDYRIHTEVELFAQQVKKGFPIMALDMGARKIGIAKTTPDHSLSLPYWVYYRKDLVTDLQFVLNVICKNNIFGVVLGITNQEDKLTDYSKHTKSFAIKLLNELSCHGTMMPLLLYDEHLTSMRARAYLQQLQYSPKQIEASEDKIAAAMILDEVIAMF